MLENVEVDIADAGSWNVTDEPGDRVNVEAMEVVRGRAGRIVGGELPAPAIPTPPDKDLGPSVEKLTRDPARFLPRTEDGLCNGASSLKGS